MSKHEIFNQELQTIINNDIREFAIVLLENAPDYFYTVAASSNGKYHPAYSLGEGGLVRHTKAVLRFVNYILELEQYKSLFTDRERDCIRIACLVHDIEKQGDGHTKHTVFEHPIYAANTILRYKGQYLNDDEIIFISKAVISHMGEWNTNKKSKIELPKPTTEAQKIVHLADYLASRKDIFVYYLDDINEPVAKVSNKSADFEDYVMPFGKHKGKKISEINEYDYFRWLKNNVDLTEPLKGFVDRMIDRGI